MIKSKVWFDEEWQFQIFLLWHFSFLNWKFKNFLPLDKAHISSHCEECLLPAPALTSVPCSTCSLARFCSLSCKTSCLSHKYECGVQESLYRSGTGAWQLAYRLVSSRPLEYWLEKRKKFSIHNEDMGLKEEDQYCSDDVMTAYNMVTHDTGESRWDHWSRVGWRLSPITL